VLVGPSGCGKSTLLRLIAGLEGPSVGDICIGGELVNDWTPRERAVAMVFQSYALYPHMTAYDNMAFGLSAGSTGSGRRSIAACGTRRNGCRSRTCCRKPAELSGGTAPARGDRPRHRARAAAVPVRRAAVQPRRRAAHADAAGVHADLHRELGTTMVYVTHDQAEAMTLASVMIVLRKGRVEQIGAPVEIYERPVNRFVAQFIGSPSMNMIAVCTENVIRFDSVTNPDSVGGDDRADPPAFGFWPRRSGPNHRLRRKTQRSGSRSSYCGASCAAA
jgi:multiple sugar transport system ATP-binding protein